MTKLSYFATLAQEIDKFAFETETEAQSLVEKELGDLRIKKNMVMEQARKALTEKREQITDMAKQLDQISAQVGNTVKKVGE